MWIFRFNLCNTEYDIDLFRVAPASCVIGYVIFLKTKGSMDENCQAVSGGKSNVKRLKTTKIGLPKLSFFVCNLLLNIIDVESAFAKCNILLQFD